MVDVLEEIATRQNGIVTRRQALDSGVSVGAIRHRLRSGAWRRLHAGVYVTFTGPVPRAAELWGAVLAGGRGAILSHDSAAELNGLLDEPAPLIHVTVPVHRMPRSVSGIRWHLSVRAGPARHPTRLPPQTTVDDTVLDLTQSAVGRPGAVSWVVRACARRLTTVDRLRVAFAGRPKLRYREQLSAVLADVAAGCHSSLELRYLNDVERGHRLPAGQRQTIRARPGGRWYDDVHYVDYGTVVEVDGGEAHPDDAHARDRRRDNAGAVAGLSTLRYGPAEILGQPCETARQVVAVLQRNGWSGHARPCRPACPVRTAHP
jgi:very-short-patch-repair endonuclease